MVSRSCYVKCVSTCLFNQPYAVFCSDVQSGMQEQEGWPPDSLLNVWQNSGMGSVFYYVQPFICFFSSNYSDLMFYWKELSTSKF